jgi:hypothetical protein
MKTKYVEVGRYESWTDADIVRNRLVAKGIRAELSNNNATGTFGMYMGTISNVRVLVPRSAAAEAKRLLSADVPRKPGRPQSTASAAPIRRKSPRGSRHS